MPSSVPIRVFGPDVLWPGRLLAIVIGLGLIGATVIYTARIAGHRAGLVAGLAVAVAPSLVANDTVTLTEPLGLLLTMGILLSMLDRRWAPAGVLCGLLLLTRPSAYLVAVVVVAVLWRSLGPRRALPALESDEAAWSNRLTAIGLRSVVEHQSSVLQRAVTGAATMLELPGHRAEEAEYVDGRDPRIRGAALVAFPVLVAAGSAGVLVRIGDRRTRPALAVVGGFVVPSLVTVSVPRLRGPFDLLMCTRIG